MSPTWTATEAWLLHVLGGGGLLLLLTCLLVAWTRQPVRRAWLADWGILAALLLAGACLGPTWVVPNSAAFTASPTPAPTPQWVLEWPENPPGEDAGPVAVLLAPEEPAPAEIIVPPDPGPPPPNFNVAALTPWLLGGYLAIGVLFLARWLCGHLALARILRQAVPAPLEVDLQFRRLASAGRLPRLLVSPRIQVPLSCGLWRPTVVLPAAMVDQPDAQRLQWIFAHELTHVERRDAWSGVLFGLAQGLFWGLPWFWWLRRQVRLCQEFVADAVATGRAEPAVDYAEFLLSLSGAPAVSLAASGVSGSGSDLYRRIAMLLQNPLPVEKKAPRRWSLAVAALLLALGIVAAGVGVRAEAADTVIIIVGGQDQSAKATSADKVKIIRAGADMPKADFFFKQVGPEGKVIPLPPGMDFKFKVQGPDGAPDMEAIKKVIEFHFKDKAGAAMKDLPFMLEHLKGKFKVGPDGVPNFEAVNKAWQALPQMKAFELKDMKIEGLKLEGQPQFQFQFQPQPEAKPVPKAGAMVEGHPMIMRLVQNEGPAKLEQVKKQLEALQKNLKDLGHVEAARELQKALREVEAQMQKGKAPGHGEMQFRIEGLELVNPMQPAKPARPADPVIVMRVMGGGTRLGIKVEAPGSQLVDQLDLQRGQGLVVTKVEPWSGFRVNDVLLAMNGQPVPSNVEAFGKMMEALKPGEPVKSIVLRKGKREAVETAQPGTMAIARDARIVNPLARDGQGQTSMTRDGERFSVRHQEGPLLIIVTGSGAGDKTRLDSVVINEGTQTHAFDSIDAVPAAHRDLVRRLVQTNATTRERR